jgi:hypothetical protein
MPDDDKPTTTSTRSRGAERDSSAGASEPAVVRRPLPGPRVLNLPEREALRAKLQRKFH